MNSIKKMKNELVSLGNRADHLEERISDIKEQKSRNNADGRRERFESKKRKNAHYKNYLTPSERAL